MYAYVYTYSKYKLGGVFRHLSRVVGNREASQKSRATQRMVHQGTLLDLGDETQLTCYLFDDIL